MPKKNDRRWTDEQLLQEIDTCKSYHELCLRLGLKKANNTLKKRIYDLGLNDSHLHNPNMGRYPKDKSSYEEKLSEFIKNSFSYAEVLEKLGRSPKGGNYSTLRKKILEQNLDTSHFTGQGWNKNKVLKRTEEYTTKKACKNSLFTVRGHRCEVCKIDKWENKSIGLELHHIDGNSLNNMPENLQILCPNCHSQTPNFRNRKRK